MDTNKLNTYKAELASKIDEIRKMYDTDPRREVVAQEIKNLKATIANIEAWANAS